MKNLYLFLLAMSFGALSAQQTASLVLFTDQGESFYVYVNNVKQNESPSNNVMISDLPTEFIKVKIQFQDPQLGEFDKNLMLSYGHQITAQIKKNRKGNFVIRPFGEPVPIATAPPRGNDDPVIIYHDEQVEAVESEDINTTEPVEDIEVTETQDASPEDSGDSSESARIGMSMDGTGVRMSIDVRDGNSVASGRVDSSTQTTTTTTTTTTERPEHRPRPTRPVHKEPEYVEEEIVGEPLIPGYNGPIGCDGFLMSDTQFNAAKSSIKSKSFEDDKMTLAKQITHSQCLTTDQVKQVMDLFTFEETKLDWAKMAYDKTYDIGNYWMLNDNFTFSSSIDELNTYIESRR